jgi:hypothetical protein
MSHFPYFSLSLLTANAFWERKHSKGKEKKKENVQNE